MAYAVKIPQCHFSASLFQKQSCHTNFLLAFDTPAQSAKIILFLLSHSPAWLGLHLALRHSS